MSQTRDGAKEGKQTKSRWKNNVLDTYYVQRTFIHIFVFTPHNYPVRCLLLTQFIYNR